MSVVPTPFKVSLSTLLSADLIPCSGCMSEDQMIPPTHDALMIRFMFYKETMHIFTPYIVQEHCMIPLSPTKAIMVRPSEFYNRDATSISQSPSGRVMIDFLNTHLPPRGKVVLPKLVARLVELVQSSIGSEIKRFIDGHIHEAVEIMHFLNDDEATRPSMEGYFKATRRGTCGICLDDYEIEFDDGIRLPCLHAFHGPCIYKWLVINPRCPVCCHPFRAPELASWFNPPVQNGIWKSHSSIVGSVDNQELSQEVCSQTHSSVGSVGFPSSSY